MTLRATTRHGFSLIELSIVLVILGLLVGGILAGQSLIRAAELRAVSSESQKYMTAISAFRDKYFSIPGDMMNATSFGAGFAGNGDGDSMIETTGTANTNEISLVWIHLSQAGLIEGTYTNIANTTLTFGTNNPRSKMSNAGWNLAWLGGIGFDEAGTPDNYFNASYGNSFLFGSSTSALLPGKVLKAEEAWNVDTKMDDGRPASGSVLSLERDAAATSTAGACSNGATSTVATMANSTYALDTTTVNCALIIESGY